jgi:molybdenum-dependent DNA-binding transcriptional regulator ModE
MYTAMQAAEQAKMSYMMTRQSVQEMNKLVSTSNRLSLFEKKKRSENND